MTHKTPDVYYTSDSHFHHRAMAERGWRPWPTIQEHDEAFITAWNETVRPHDVVYHLGDWGMGPDREHLPVLMKLHGTVHLITGNHDHPWAGFRDASTHLRTWLNAGFTSIQPFMRRRIGGRNVMLSHFPYVGDAPHSKGGDRFDQYRLRDLGMPLLHGHVHDAWSINGHQFNVGVDVNEWRPVSQDVVAAVLTAADRVAELRS